MSTCLMPLWLNLKRGIWEEGEAGSSFNPGRQPANHASCGRVQHSASTLTLLLDVTGWQEGTCTNTCRQMNENTGKQHEYTQTDILLLLLLTTKQTRILMFPHVQAYTTLHNYHEATESNWIEFSNICPLLPISTLQPSVSHTCLAPTISPPPPRGGRMGWLMAAEDLHVSASSECRSVCGCTAGTGPRGLTLSAINWTFTQPW